MWPKHPQGSRLLCPQTHTAIHCGSSLQANAGLHQINDFGACTFARSSSGVRRIQSIDSQTGSLELLFPGTRPQRSTGMNLRYMGFCCPSSRMHAEIPECTIERRLWRTSTVQSGTVKVMELDSPEGAYLFAGRGVQDGDFWGVLTSYSSKLESWWRLAWSFPPNT